jgi:acyl transferase domain-containing protein/thioesterase domain-containing protein
MIREPIAIIGIGCRFPLADSPQSLWELLCEGGDAIASMPSDRRQLYPFSQIDDAKLEALQAKWGGFLDGIDQFDASFFGIAPSEAVAIDPQQRLLLEVSWMALEDAAIDCEQIRGSQTGVFMGMTVDGYEAILQGGDDQTAYTSFGTSNAIAVNRISQYFDFQGASLAVNTTCSSSLVAVDIACQSIWSGESLLALAGGINIFANLGLSPQSAELISPTHRCRSFAESADGYVRSEGVGVVVLKPMSQALADGDRIYAVIRGSAVRHNGSGNGLAVPNLQAQESLLRHIYQKAELSLSAVDYLEAHATGTKMGDAVEIKAIERILNPSSLPLSLSPSLNDSEQHQGYIGTVKTNIGHTETASGIAGIIKAALVVYHRQIPSNLHFDHPSAYIEFEKLPFRVPTESAFLPKERTVYAGVSAFGVGGTNAHVILESAPSVPIANNDVSTSSICHVLILSAKTEQALRQIAINYQQFLAKYPELAIAQICATAARRSQFKYRLAIMANAIDDLQNKLSYYLSGQSWQQLVEISSEISSGKANPNKYKRKSLEKILINSETSISELIRNYPDRALEQIIFDSSALPELDEYGVQSLRSQILELWVNGADVDWKSLYINCHINYHSPIVSLPSYPFERNSFWVQPQALSISATTNKVISIEANTSTINEDRTESETLYVAPRNQVEQKLQAIWEKVFNLHPISIHDNFFEIGGTSLIAVDLFTKIDQTFKCHLGLVFLFQYPTIAELAELLNQQQEQNQKRFNNLNFPWSTLVPIRASGLYSPLFCVSGIHGNVLIYADLAKNLGEAQPFYGLQSKGLDGIQSPHTSIEEMATYYIEAIKTVQPQGPYFLGGFSLGSKVVWEMAQQLHRQGEKVALLALFDGTTRATNIGRLPFYKRIFLHYQNLREMGFTYISQKFPSWREWLSGRYDYWTKKITRNIFQKLQIPLPIYLRQSAIADSLEKAGTHALKNYVIRSYPDKATLFRAEIQSADQGVGFVPPDWDLGWGKLATGGLEIQPVIGDHISMFREPQVQVLAQKLQDCLIRAREECP